MTAFRPPAEDGAVLCAPPAAHWPGLLRRNAAAADRGTVGGLPRADWRRAARGECAPDLDPAAPWWTTGHQPELFHPGVWAKSFAVAGAVRRAGGVGVHVDTDNDLAAALRLALVTRTGAVASVPLDLGNAEAPWEERRTEDAVYFLDFPQRSADCGGDLADTLAPAAWAGFRRQLAADPETPLGTLFAAARQEAERAWGVRNHSAPLSRLCDGPSFRRFAADALLRAEEFAARHNGALASYRMGHRLRSRHHPFADLAADGAWHETPFWGWTARAPRRRAVFARCDGARLALRCGPHEAALPVRPGDAAGAAAEGLASLPFKLRPRALMTTAFLRLGLADVFVHGVGGARYDALTDVLLEQFWRVPAPAFATVTGTLRLPAAPNLGPLADELRACGQRVRALRWNPDEHLPEHLADAEALAPALERKSELLVEAPAQRRRPARARWREFRRLAEQLRPYVAGELAAAERAAAAAAERLALGRLQAARDFAWCVHPAARLRSFLAALA